MNLIPGHTVVQGHYNRGGEGREGTVGSTGYKEQEV